MPNGHSTVRDDPPERPLTPLPSPSNAATSDTPRPHHGPQRPPYEVSRHNALAPAASFSGTELQEAIAGTESRASIDPRGDRRQRNGKGPPLRCGASRDGHFRFAGCLARRRGGQRSTPVSVPIRSDPGRMMCAWWRRRFARHSVAEEDGSGAGLLTSTALDRLRRYRAPGPSPCISSAGARTGLLDLVCRRGAGQSVRQRRTPPGSVRPRLRRDHLSSAAPASS